MKTLINTGLKDARGKDVFVGDKIIFLFWETGSDGLQHEKFYTGRIRLRKDHLVFAYKPDGIHLSERRLSVLNFDSEMDREKVTV